MDSDTSMPTIVDIRRHRLVIVLKSMVQLQFTVLYDQLGIVDMRLVGHTVPKSIGNIFPSHPVKSESPTSSNKKVRATF